MPPHYDTEMKRVCGHYDNCDDMNGTVCTTGGPGKQRNHVNSSEKDRSVPNCVKTRNARSSCLVLNGVILEDADSDLTRKPMSTSSITSGEITPVFTPSARGNESPPSAFLQDTSLSTQVDDGKTSHGSFGESYELQAARGLFCDEAQNELRGTSPENKRGEDVALNKCTDSCNRGFEIKAKSPRKLL